MHAPLAPSSGPVWFFCAGSVQMQARFPQDSTDDSRAGDAAHWLCMRVLTTYATGSVLQDAPAEWGTASKWVGHRDPAGTVITLEMCEAVQMYVDAIMRKVDATPGGRSLMHVERLTQCPSIHPTACFGTPDFNMYAPLTNTLYVDDFKFGHDYVEEYDNKQMIIYLQGKLDEMGVDGAQDQDLNVELTIHQPRYYRASPVRTWKFKASDIRATVNVLKYQGEKALMPDAECVSGNHCKNCTARLNCDAARQSAYWAMSVSTQPMPINLTPEMQGTELRYIKRAIAALKYMESAHMERAEALIDQNVVVPGFARQAVLGQRRWRMDDPTMILVGSACGYDVRSEKAITPAAAERLGFDAEFIKQQTERPTSMKVKAVDDSTVKKVFS